MPEESTKGNGHDQQADAAFLAELKTLDSSVILDRIRWARQAGITFGGERDEYEVLGYDRVITPQQFRDEYARGGIAGRIVDAMPNATWRGTFELIEDDDPKKNTPFEQAWKDLDTRLQIQAKLLRADKLSQLSTYAVLLIGAPGDLEQELPKGNPDQLLYLQPFIGGGGPSGSGPDRIVAAGADASIYEFELDPSNARFGLPKSYQIKRVDISTPQLARPVHWTRIIHIAEGLLENEVYGQPSLERVWNLLCDLRKVTGGGAEAFWLRANQGLHLNIDKDMSLPDAQNAIAALKVQAEEYKHQLTRWLRTRGVEVETLGSDVANFEQPADAILTQISGAKAIPKRILTGSEMGELASSQDRDNWKDQVNGRQTQYAGPYIVRPLVDRLIEYGYLPKPSKGERAYEVRWPQIQTLTEAEKSAGAKDWASTNSTQGTPVFLSREIRDKWYGMAPLTPEEIEEELELTKTAQEAIQPPVKVEEEEEKKEKELLKVAAANDDDELFTILQEALETGAMEVVDAIIMRTAGGKGSGFWNHSGRPGKRGGSSSAGVRQGKDNHGNSTFAGPGGTYRISPDDYQEGQVWVELKGTTHWQPVEFYKSQDEAEAAAKNYAEKGIDGADVPDDWMEANVPIVKADHLVAPQPDTSAFAKHFEAQGFKTQNPATVPQEIKDGMPNMRDPITPPKAMIEGIDAGIKDIETAVPALADAMRRGDIKLVYTAYDPAASATSVAGPEGKWLFINGSQEAIGLTGDLKNSKYTIATQRASQMGLTGDDYTREVYRGVVVHEAGHFVDIVTNGGVSALVMDSMILHGVPAAQMPRFVGENLSPYSSRGGPVESAAELFTAAVFDRKVHPAFKNAVAVIKKLNQPLGGRP